MLNPAVFGGSDLPTVARWLAAQEDALGRLQEVADTVRIAQPVRAMYLDVEVERRARELLAIREWLDLR